MLYNTLSRLPEASTRVNPGLKNPKDWKITQRTIYKCHAGLTALESPFIWNAHTSPSLVELDANIKWIQFEAQTWEKAEKASRNKIWKCRIAEAEQGSMKYIYIYSTT